LDVRQLTYFLKVIEAGSFTRAAEILHMAQPALSQQVQKLENELGQRLLVRHSRGVTATEAGNRLLGHARFILQSVDAARQDVRQFSGEAIRQIRLGIPRSLSAQFAIGLERSWSRQWGEVTLCLVEFMNSHLAEWLLTGRLDLALTYAAEDQERIQCEPILQESFCLAGPRGTGPGDRRLSETSFQRLPATPLILPSTSHDNRKLIDAAAEYCNARLSISHEIDSLEVTLGMVEAGLGYTVQPFLAIQHLLAAGRISAWHIVQPEVRRRLHIAHSRHSLLSPNLARALDELRRYLRSVLSEIASPLVEVELALA
jgi:LysR family nitrogen assimilation transcriptional regulator